MNHIKDYFRSKSIGFYISIITAILSIVAVSVYASGFGETKYMSWTSLVFVIVSLVAAIILEVFKKHELVPAVIFIGTFGSLLFFIYGVYLYVVTSVYAASVINFKPEFSYAVIFYIIALIVGIVAIYLKQTKTPKEAK